MKYFKKISHPSCPGCDACLSGFRHLGIDSQNWDYVVALAGNPNTGKSTVFNALTGLRQHTGNWPGKTVVRAEGGFQYEEKRYKLIDLPGTYSLLSMSSDEEIARDFILFGRPDCTIVVVDATCLERNLNLVLQVLEITGKVVIALNLMDEAQRKSIDIDDGKLARHLGVPVVPMAARLGQGMARLIEEIKGLVSGRTKTHPHRIQQNAVLKKAVDELAPRVEKLCPGLPNIDWVCMRLIDGDPRIREALVNGELASLAGKNTFMMQ